MTKTAHTPGPWEAEPMEDGCSVAYRINDAHGYEIGVTSGRDGESEEAANARLIAAAPDMLAALKECLPLFDMVTALDDHGSNVLGQAENLIRAAIAEAEDAR